MKLQIAPVTIILLVLALLGGGAFAVKQGNLAFPVAVTQSHVDSLHEVHLAFQGFAVYYRCSYDNSPAGCVTSSGKITQVRCASGIHATLSNLCTERAIVVQVQGLDQTITSQLAVLDQGFAACKVSGSGTCSGLSATYLAAKDTLSTGRAIAAQFGFSLPPLPFL